MRQAAQHAGLPPLRPVGGKDAEADAAVPMEAPAASPATAAAETAAPPAAPAADFLGSGRAAMLVTDPVRSGQRIYAQDADLIITATVNPGAEVIADGNIHVYGALRGRAVAGASDDATARIFALNFDPELVAIAGFYAVREGLGSAPIGKPTQVRLEGEEMRFAPLGS
ncbi:MAG: septum site-determining protein MinC [Acetobacteraceae bacterium]|nr:MAG: septum site-determining protein MinC [Acetobacteraceae bacterium]